MSNFRLSAIDQLCESAPGRAHCRLGLAERHHSAGPQGRIRYAVERCPGDDRRRRIPGEAAGSAVSEYGFWELRRCAVWYRSCSRNRRPTRCAVCVHDAGGMAHPPRGIPRKMHRRCRGMFFRLGWHYTWRHPWTGGGKDVRSTEKMRNLHMIFGKTMVEVQPWRSPPRVAWHRHRGYLRAGSSSSTRRHRRVALRWTGTSWWGPVERCRA